MTSEADIQEICRQEATAYERIIRDGHEVIPSFRIYTPGGDYKIFVPMRPDLEHRAGKLRMMALFMAWKRASCFYMTSEIIEPDALVVFYVAHSSSLGIMKTIQRNPIGFGDEQWFDHQNIDPELLKLRERSVMPTWTGGPISSYAQA